VKIGKTAISSLKRAQVVVCKGCCCGRVDRGHNEVPIDALKSLWKNFSANYRFPVAGTLPSL